jgi:hypothetical protein
VDNVKWLDMPDKDGLWWIANPAVHGAIDIATVYNAAGGVWMIAMHGYPYVFSSSEIGPRKYTPAVKPAYDWGV